MYWAPVHVVCATGIAGLVVFLAGCDAGRDTSASPVQLTSERRGQSIELRWKATASGAGHIRSVVLRVTDSGTERVVPLSDSMLSAGHVSYYPQSGDVLLKLDVEMDNARHVVESVRVLDAAPPATFTAAAPVPAPENNSADRARTPIIPIAPPDFKLPPRDVREIPAPPTLAVWHVPDSEANSRDRRRSPGALLQSPAYPSRRGTRR